VEILVAGNEIQWHTVMAAVAMGCRKRAPSMIVQGRTVRRERGPELGPQWSHISTRSPTGSTTVAARLVYLRLRRNVTEYPDHRYKDMIADGQCRDDGLAMASGPGIVPHFVPPGLTHPLQPLDRSVVGAFRAGHRAVHGMDMSQGEDRPMIEADFGADLI
jgi:hypothetical protein